MNDSWKNNDTSDELHVTFMFHCAFVRTEGARRTDVILAPGFIPPSDDAQVAAERGEAGTDQEHAGHGPDDQHASSTHDHPMRHIASLRIPRACVVDDELAVEPKYEIQETTTFTETGVRVDEDIIWRLEGWDVSIQPDGLAAAPSSTPANFESAATDGTTTYTLASIATLAGADERIDPRFKSDDDVPELLYLGSRVRVWGGTLTCQVPGGLLRHRTWHLGLENPVGMSDRVDYKRSVPAGGSVIVFKHFVTRETKTVRLQPQNGVIRMHVTNDPFVEDTPHGSREKNPCETLPHFPSYAVLLEPAGKVRNLSVPPLANTGMPELVTISEGNTYCCPCGDGVP